MKIFIKVTALLSAIMLILPVTGVFAFTDTESHWAKEHIEWANENGIVSGYPDNNFKPDGFIKNVEFYKMINEMKGFTEKTKISFEDVPENAIRKN